MKKPFSTIRFFVMFVFFSITPFGDKHADDGYLTIHQVDQQYINSADETVISISAGLEHTCIVTSEGKVKCWGANYNGQVGDGTTTYRLLPINVEGLMIGALRVTAGGHHDAFFSDGYSCILTSSNGVMCWGANGAGQLGNRTNVSSLTPVDVFSLTSGVADVQAGGAHTCALTQGGGVKCWGSNTYGELGDGTTVSKNQPVDVLGLTSGVLSITVGPFHNCAILSDGTAKCWGINYYGELGDGSTINSSVPVNVSGITQRIKSIAAGSFHSCAILEDGSARCWGNNIYGQLGNNSTTDSLNPVLVQGLSTGSNITTGNSHTCAVMTNGTVKCWGKNDFGQLGDGSTIQRLSPVSVSSLLEGVSKIDAGHSHTCSILSNGSIKCWGRNLFGQIGTGQTGFRSVPIETKETIYQSSMLSIGREHSCAVGSNDELQCWGANSYGQLGDGTITLRTNPTLVSGFSSGAKYVSAGGYHTCAINSNNGVLCWGQNKYGQLGIDNTTDQRVPRAVTGLDSNIQAVASGIYHTCALTTEGGVKCWGWNSVGQLGDRSTISSTVPVNVEGLTTGVVAIKAGYLHTCALNNTGSVMCWGSNAYGMLGDNTGENSSTPVPVVRLTTDVKSISLGNYHTCALMNWGAVKCWGWNLFGRLGQDGSVWDQGVPTDVPALSSGVIELTSGDHHNCVLTLNNQVKCWGYNAFGQLGGGKINVEDPYGEWLPVNTLGISNLVTGLYAGGNSNCIQESSTVKCWGDNRFGQVGDGKKGIEPIPVVVNPSCPLDSWYSEYYSSRDLDSGPAFAGCDAEIDFYWGDISPGNPLQKDNFSVSWKKTVNFPETGWYRFRTFTDDGLRLYIDGESVIDDWIPRSFDERSVLRRLDAGPHTIVMEYVEWSNDAMAYLNWYLCPNGSGDCNLNITPEYQTNYLDVPMPADCTTVVNQTLARWGCLVTSLSMNMQAFGINTTADTLNQWFTDNGYYPTPCYGGINRYTMEAPIAFARSHGVNLRWTPLRTIEDAVNAIRAEHPVVLQVADGGHWVLAVDVLSQDDNISLGLNDPHHSYRCRVLTGTPSLPPNSILVCGTGTLRHATTVSEENENRGLTVPYGYLEPMETGEARTPSLTFSITGTETMLVDEAGQETGYSSTSGTYTYGIPYSFYFNSEIVPFGETTSGILQRNLYISRDAAGSYLLKVIGSSEQTASIQAQDQEFTIDIVGFDEDFNKIETSIVGSIGDNLDYQIMYRPNMIQVTPIAFEQQLFLPLTTR